MLFVIGQKSERWMWIVDCGHWRNSFELLMVNCTEGDSVPKLRTVLCLCIHNLTRFNRGVFSGAAAAQWLQRATLQSSFPMACGTIHFQLKDSQTLLAGPSIVTQALIVLLYLTAGLQGFDSPV